MIALDPGPAPTLLTDWTTTPGFWVIVLILCTLALVVVTAEILRDRREDAQPAPHIVNWCDRNGHVFRHTGGWRCTHCGHQPAEQVYDQALDTVEDYANGQAS